jgi:hypothetical protein
MEQKSSKAFVDCEKKIKRIIANGYGGIFAEVDSSLKRIWDLCVLHSENLEASVVRELKLVKRSFVSSENEVDMITIGDKKLKTSEDSNFFISDFHTIENTYNEDKYDFDTKQDFRAESKNKTNQTTANFAISKTATLIKPNLNIDVISTKQSSEIKPEDMEFNSENDNFVDRIVKLENADQDMMFSIEPMLPLYNYQPTKDPQNYSFTTTANGKTFKCDFCDHITTNKNYLVQHIKAKHTIIKDFPCKECSYAASQKTNLVLHVKANHSNTKDFQCEKCSYATVYKDSFAQHVKAIHTDIKDFECKRCNFKTAHKKVLLKHNRVVHDKIKEHQCEQCGYTTGDKGVLLKHIDAPLFCRVRLDYVLTTLSYERF